MCQSEICEREKKPQKLDRRKLLLKSSWEFSKLLLALLCHQLEELFILAQLKICLPSVPFYSSAGLMFNVSVLMA